MRNSILVTLVTIGATTGCSLWSRNGAPKVDDPRVATPPLCALPGTTANTCIQRGNKWTCDVHVGQLPDGSPYVFPDTLKVPARTRATIVWHLHVPNGKFVRGQDGPVWKRASDYATISNPEFEDGDPTDDPDGEVGGPEGGKYKVKFKNGSGPNASHRYLIQYRVGSTVKACDPHIVSEGG